jgi:dolichol-phosphate mannosyltransferase
VATQLVRYCSVGASGYAINVAVSAVALTVFDLPVMPTAILAFCIAATSNFLWNRRWTFRGHTERAHRQAVRFLVVSVAAFVFNLIVLEILVTVVELPEVPAQAIAIAAATPLSFLGNKLWTFGR